MSTPRKELTIEEAIRVLQMLEMHEAERAYIGKEIILAIDTLIAEVRNGDDKVH